MQSKLTRRGFVGLTVAAAALSARTARADAPADAAPEAFPVDEVVDDGHRFFGTLSRGLADVVQEAGRRWGLPNAYVLGQEASAAFVGGLRYGEGKMYTRNAGNRPVYWQGPSVGFDAGGDGDRTMMLVYNLPAVELGLPPVWRPRRIGLFHRRFRLHRAQLRQHCRGSDPYRCWRQARSQCELFEIHRPGDLESVLAYS